MNKLLRILNRSVFLLLACTMACITFSCKRNFAPKPRGFFRIDLPEKEYKIWDENFPYRFECLRITNVKKDESKNAEKYWLNIEYPTLNASIYISYKNVNNNLEKYLEDSRELAYKHSIKADAITEQAYSNPEKNVHSLLYQIKGNVASSIQFVATDSSKHFLRGALYFNTRPNQDSLAPVIQYINEDITRLIESLEWN